MMISERSDGYWRSNNASVGDWDVSLKNESRDDRNPFMPGDIVSVSNIDHVVIIGVVLWSYEQYGGVYPTQWKATVVGILWPDVTTHWEAGDTPMKWS